MLGEKTAADERDRQNAICCRPGNRPRIHSWKEATREEDKVLERFHLQRQCVVVGCVTMECTVLIWMHFNDITWRKFALVSVMPIRLELCAS